MAKKPAAAKATSTPRNAAATCGTSSRRVRISARSNFGGSGGYEGARPDRAALKNWTPREGSPDADTLPDINNLRARTRDLARNAPLVAGALETKLTCMIGPGLAPHPRIDRKFLGLTDAQADEWQAQASRLWWAWAGSTRCDIRRRGNFAHLTWIVARSWLTNGDHFVRRRNLERAGDLFALKLQQIEADRVSTPDNVQETPTFKEGIEFDADGAITQIHVASRHPGDSNDFTAKAWAPQQMFGPITGEPLILQIGLFDRDGQTRPVSVFAPVIEALKQLTRYAGAELDAAVATSFISAFIESADGESDLLGDMGTPKNPAVGLQGSDATASDDRHMHLAPAAIFQLEKGEKLQSFNPNRPNANFDPFFRAFCSIIGAAVELPHELLIKHFTSSYSASRGALLEAWRSFRTKRSLVLIDQFAQPVYDWLITEAVARGYLVAPQFWSSPLVKRAYLECAWSGPIMGQLNPLDEANAAIKRVDAGFSTAEEETAELTGGDDWEAKHHQRAKEHRMRVEAKLEPEVLGTNATQSIEPATADARDAKDKSEQPAKPSTPPAE